MVCLEKCSNHTISLIIRLHGMNVSGEGQVLTTPPIPSESIERSDFSIRSPFLDEKGDSSPPSGRSSPLSRDSTPLSLRTSTDEGKLIMIVNVD